MFRPLSLAVALLMAAPGLPLPAARTYSPPERSYWLQPVPGNDAEAAVHTTLTDPALAGKPEAAAALRDLAAHHPGGSAAGLARLAAGLLLLDHQKYAEAEPLLLDSEIAKTRLEDHAAKALAELYEKTGDFAKSADQYDKVVGHADPNPFRCVALLRGAEVHDVIGARDNALEMLQRALSECPGREAQALLQIGSVQQRRGDARAAAEAFDRLDRDYPGTAQGKEAAQHLRMLGPTALPATPQERLGRDLKKALVLFEAGEHTAAVRLFQALLLRKASPADADLIHVRLGRALMALDRDAQAKV